MSPIALNSSITPARSAPPDAPPAAAPEVPEKL